MGTKLREVGVYRADVSTRLPFKYGIATMTHLPHVFVRVVVEVDGQPSVGVAADHLPPKWFTKDPARAVEAEIDDMLAVIRQACAAAQAVGEAATVFDFWWALWQQQERWATERQVPLLLAHFGTSLIERALIDAACRAWQSSFAVALHDGCLGVDLGRIHSELRGTTPADWLPARPLATAIARHTVGFADPLTEAEIAPDARVHDGLPQSLEAAIARYGLRHFKLKVNKEHGCERLATIGAVLERGCAGTDWAWSLDCNESFTTVGEARKFWSELCADRRLTTLRSRLLFVEQPFHRDMALSDAVAGFAAGLPEAPRFIIDESDAGLHSAARALELGYAGTSHKNCKGVFKGVANACLLARRRRQSPDLPWVLSGEDLANIGPVALLQDLAVQAALGIESVERNGHHYFAGLSFWPEQVQQSILAAHADLYRPSDGGWPTLTVRDGRIALSSINAAPFGVGFAFEPAACGTQIV